MNIRPVGARAFAPGRGAGVIDQDKILEGVRKTGFDLEFRVSEILRGSGWNVINNRYCVDDQQETVRQIDLVAYKFKKYDDLWVYTSLIVSCKKNDQKSWAFLSKNINPTDPNTEWRPLHVWTNDKALEFTISQAGFSGLRWWMRKSGCS